MSEHDWQRAHGAYLTRMLDTGRYPALARFVREGTETDPGTSFDIGLDWILDAIAAKLA
ncbi:TetR/AcrR family transcriptional regulator C-terminal domain-containing protein [Nonomuraea coxensis]